MKMLANLPLSSIEREAYRALVIEMQPAQQVAERLKLSITALRQMVARVTDALIAAAPIETPEDRKQRVHQAEQIAAARLGMLYREAMESYRRSRGVQTTIRQVNGKAPVTTQRYSDGDQRYLNVAAKIALLASKMPCGNLCDELPSGLDEAANAASASSASPETAKLEAPKTENHPDRACSTPAAQPPVTAKEFPITGDAKSTDELISDILNRAGKIRNQLSSGPVQDIPPNKRRQR